MKTDSVLYRPPWSGSVLTLEWNRNRPRFIPEIFSQLLGMVPQSFCCCSLPVRWSRRDLLFDPFWLISLLLPLLSPIRINKKNPKHPFFRKQTQGRGGRRGKKSSKWKSLPLSLPNHLKTVSYFWQALNIQSLVCKMRSKRKVEHMTNLRWLYINMAAETFFLFAVRRNIPSTSAWGVEGSTCTPRWSQTITSHDSPRKCIRLQVPPTLQLLKIPPHLYFTGKETSTVQVFQPCTHKKWRCLAVAMGSIVVP